MMDMVLLVAALCIIPAAILTAYQSVTLYRFRSVKNRLPLTIHVREDRTCVSSETFRTEVEFENVAIVTKRRGRRKVLRFDGPRLDKPADNGVQIVDLGHPGDDLTRHKPEPNRYCCSRSDAG